MCVIVLQWKRSLAISKWRKMKTWTTLSTFLRFLTRHFKKNRKKSRFLDFQKNVKRYSRNMRTALRDCPFVVRLWMWFEVTFCWPIYCWTCWCRQHPAVYWQYHRRVISTAGLTWTMWTWRDAGRHSRPTVAARQPTYSSPLILHVSCKVSFPYRFVRLIKSVSQFLIIVFSRPSFCVCLSLTLCIVSKRCVLEQKLLLTAYRKSYINRLVPKWMTLTFV